MLEADGAWLRMLALVLRGVLWLVWEFLMLQVGWRVGWPVWRVLTVGRFPHAGFNDIESAGGLECIVISGSGIALLTLAVWGLTGTI